MEELIEEHGDGIVSAIIGIVSIAITMLVITSGMNIFIDALERTI